MNWEQTIKFIRTKPEFKELVDKAYFEEELPLNVERFRQSEEFLETKKLLKQTAPGAKRILDIGSGNGISCVSFALEGYEVVTVEPDSSDTIGAGAIRILKSHYKLNNLLVFESFAEDLNFPKESFDIVYSRQCMHHANNLKKFVSEACRVLKNGGLFFTVRDHVIYNSEDKAWFLQTHPLHHFYGGENAFTLNEYKSAIESSGLKLIKVLKHFDSVINYFPITESDIKKQKKLYKKQLKETVKKYYGFFSILNFISNRLINKIKHIVEDPIDESKIPGRMYSFISIKQ